MYKNKLLYSVNFALSCSYYNVKCVILKTFVHMMYKVFELTVWMMFSLLPKRLSDCVGISDINKKIK